MYVIPYNQTHKIFHSTPHATDPCKRNGSDPTTSSPFSLTNFVSTNLPPLSFIVFIFSSRSSSALNLLLLLLLSFHTISSILPCFFKSDRQLSANILTIYDFNTAMLFLIHFFLSNTTISNTKNYKSIRVFHSVIHSCFFFSSILSLWLTR